MENRMYKKAKATQITEKDLMNFPPLPVSTPFHWPRNPSGLIDIYNGLDDTINRLKNYGVTKTLIKQYWKPALSTTDWSEICKHTLIYLVTGKHNSRKDFLPPEQCLSPIDALHEMSGLCLNRIHTLENLYRYGVRGEHLRDLHGAENELSSNHCFALEQLVEQNVPILEAIDQVNQMTKDDAENITFPNMTII